MSENLLVTMGGVWGLTELEAGSCFQQMTGWGFEVSESGRGSPPSAGVVAVL